MSVENSLEGVMQFWKKNQDLITQITNTGKDAVGTIQTLADQLEQNRQDVKGLVDGLNKANFLVTKDADIKKEQQDLLGRIQQQQDELTEFEDSPELTTGILVEIADLYDDLADTYDDTISGFIPFTNDEIDEINGLLQQAAVDAADRQNWAGVLNATIKLTEMALKIAAKVAA